MNNKIMVVDDDLAILEVIKIILEDKGYQVFANSNAAAIEESIEEIEPAVILLDIWMSGFDGRDIAKVLKTKHKTKKIPIIVISAHNDTEKMAKEAGADDFLAKPFDIEDLLSKVDQYVRSHTA